jgi:competence protein ComEC
MLHLVDPFTATGVASLRLPEYSGWATLLYVLYFVPLLVLANLLFKWNPLAPFSSRIKRRRDRRWLRVAGFTQVWLVILIVAHPLSSGSTQGRLRLDFLDVGQGDAALVTFPDGTTLLIDAGGKPNFSRGSGQPDSFERDSRAIGEAVVSQYLWQRGLSAVDYVLATHADADHIDGLNDVARNFRVRAALVGRAPTTDPEYARFAHSCETEGIPVTVLAAGDVLQVGTTATVLWPPANASPEAPSRNNDSLVVRLEFGARRMLLTGDIEAAAEAALVRGGANLQADIVKVAHHGSKTSSTEAFVLRTGGRYAIISVGLNSMFGHPHKEVVEQWKARGAEILTTGRSGTITVSTDGSDLRLETFVER